MALTNSQYDTIMRIYEQKRLRTHDLLTRRYSEIYEKLPRIHEIDNEISHLGVANARALIDGNTDAPSSMRSPLKRRRCFLLPATLLTIWSLTMSVRTARTPDM